MIHMKAPFHHIWTQCMLSALLIVSAQTLLAQEPQISN